MKIGIYPGSFDPLTKGHLDIIERSANVFDKLIVAVSVNISKNPMFTLDERIELIKESAKHIENVEVVGLNGLLVDFVNKFEDAVIIKGLRTQSDFEYEFQMALLNNALDSEVETVFMMTSSKYSYVSSTMVKEVNHFGGDISRMVPTCVAIKMKEKRGEKCKMI